MPANSRWDLIRSLKGSKPHKYNFHCCRWYSTKKSIGVQHSIFLYSSQLCVNNNNTHRIVFYRKMVTRTRYIIILYVHCIFCLTVDVHWKWIERKVDRFTQSSRTKLQSIFIQCSTNVMVSLLISYIPKFQQGVLG